MAFLPSNFNPIQPIPNNPFYSPESTFVYGPYHWWMSVPGGAGFDFATGTFTGAGGTGTLTSITAGPGLTGGTITTSGTIGIAPTGVTSGTYTNPIISVNSLGQITAVTPQLPALTSNLLTAKGDLISATGPDAPTILPVGAPGYILTADPTSASGLLWAPAAPIFGYAEPFLEGIVYGSTHFTPEKNVSLGYGAWGTCLGQCNVAIGYESLPSTNSAAQGNTALGTFSLLNATSSIFNVGVGFSALSGIVSGSNNVGVGAYAGCTNVSTLNNTAVGSCALRSHTGNSNVAVGYLSIFGPSAGGDENTAAGTCSLINVTGSRNVAVGACSLINAVSSGCNVAIGYRSGSSQTVGDRNVAIGPEIDVPITNGSCQLAIGQSPGRCWLTGCQDLAIKPGAGIIDCTGSCGITGQVLQSTGVNSLLWATPGGAVVQATPVTYGIMLGCTTDTNSGKTSLGCNAMLNSTGTFNTAVGTCSQRGTTSGAANTSIGHCSLLNNTTGTGQVAVGNHALAATTTNGCNTAVGSYSMASAGTPTFNTAIGRLSLCSTNGSNNTAVGDLAMMFGTNASFNTAVGSQASCSILSGLLNSSLGYQSLRSNVSGCENVAVGAQALLVSSSSLRTTAVGTCALISAMNSCDNTAVGWGSSASSTTGGCNSAFGSGSLCCNTTGVFNTAVGIGSQFASTTGSSNTTLGAYSGNAITSGSQNLALGFNAQVVSAVGSCQLAIGFDTGQNWLTGTSTKAIRPGAGVIDCNGSCGSLGQVLTSTGANAILWSTGGSGASQATPTFPGTVYGSTSIIFNNGVYFGYCAGNAAAAGGTGTQSVGIGAAALANENASFAGNVAIGFNAMLNNAGVSNTAIGCVAGRGLTTGNQNTMIGARSGGDLTTGSNNTTLGRDAGFGLTTGSNNIVIGAGAQASLPGINGEVTVGNLTNTSYRIYSAGWSNISDARDKANVEDLALGLDFVKSLRPVRFEWKFRGDGGRDGETDIGFLAQEVLDAQKEADADYAQFVNESNPDQLMLTQARLFPVLVKALQEMSEKVEQLEAKLNNL